MSKLALPPFHNWLKPHIKFLSIPELVIILVVQKLPLIFFIFIISDRFYVWPLMAITRRSLSVIFMLSEINFSGFFFFSSSLQANLLLLFSLINKLTIVFILCAYGLIVSLFLYSPSIGRVNPPGHTTTSFNLIITFLFLLGLPPSPIFFFKLLLILFIFTHSTSLISIFLLLLFFSSQCVYFYWTVSNLSPIIHSLPLTNPRISNYLIPILLIVFINFIL